MDDLKNRETSAARVVTLPSPADFLAGLARRSALQHAFLVRAESWALARAGGDESAVVIVYPQDTAVITALGVPCFDCFGLVYRQGEAGHTVRFGVDPENGRPWASLIWASCEQAGA